ncbi:MAG: cell division protein FtsL [Burkholderiaceae bacterium]|jgi:cell division protein FtsL|nr:cell division protein FtsL [Burkholderiaceae bacterium]
MRSGHLQIILVVALVICALMLVNVRYRSRKLFVELEFELAQARQLEVEWAQLQLDQSALGKPARIEASATRDLNMVHVTPANTRFMTVTVK